MRILVDHSGYDLLNIGDVAMLQACVARLRREWPGAEIMVIAHAPQRLAFYCPGATAIGPTYAGRRFLRGMPRKPRLATEQAWKAAAPYLGGHRRKRRESGSQPRTAVQAVRAADLVVASGGGFVTDTWWWHAAGVLSLLSLAQRLGKPTAMFGQGLGPLGHRALRVQARSVLPELSVIGLREGRMGPGLARSLGAAPGAVKVTGDDALELIGDTGVAKGCALGVNFRVAAYAGTSAAAAAAVAAPLLGAAGILGAPIVSLPVCRYPGATDLSAIEEMLRVGRAPADVELRDITTPQALATAAAQCRAIVTGSYHAAVFALAQGIPAVCLTQSSYYDAKFGGLSELFPGAVIVAALDLPNLADRVRTAISQAWNLPAGVRADTRATAVRLRDAGRDAYRQFHDAVDERSVIAAANGRDEERDYANS